jgi:hypothetical protein
MRRLRIERTLEASTGRASSGEFSSLTLSLSRTGEGTCAPPCTDVAEPNV